MKEREIKIEKWVKKEEQRRNNEENKNKSRKSHIRYICGYVDTKEDKDNEIFLFKNIY
jgi:hypothetical protein